VVELIVEGRGHVGCAGNGVFKCRHWCFLGRGNGGLVGRAAHGDLDGLVGDGLVNAATGGGDGRTDPPAITPLQNQGLVLALLLRAQVQYAFMAFVITGCHKACTESRDCRRHSASATLFC
jgi:hypothetical protein